MKILITGAFGLIGRQLVADLEQRGHALRLLDRVPPQEATMFNPGQAERRAAPMVTHWPCVQADLGDAAAVRAATIGMDAVVHLAAALTGEHERGPAIFHTNACGTYNVLDAARLAGVQRVLCASSINAFGTFYWRVSGRPVAYTTMPLTEDFPPVPEDPYSLSKHVNELTSATFTRAFGLTTAAFRFAGVCHEEGYARMRDTQAPTTAWSDDLYQWVHVRDVVTGLRQAVECPTLPAHGVYTLSAADTRCPEATMELLQRFRPDLAATVAPALIGRAPLLSIDRARRAFGYAPQYRLGP